MFVSQMYNSNALLCVRHCRLRMSSKLCYTTTLHSTETKCFPNIPLKLKPLYLNKSVECSMQSNVRCKFYCTESNTNLPKLMEFPEITWPSIIKTARNWILSYFIIKRHFDNDFNLDDFVQGSKKAVEVVSGLLSEGEVSNLKGLVDDEIIPEIKSSLSSFSVAQRQYLSVIEDDMYFAFPYEVGVIFPNQEENSDKQQIFVEITMCYHVLKGLGDMKENGVVIPMNVGIMPEYRGKIFICNYRFIREFTKGVNGEWVINIINHYRPADQIPKSL